MKKNPPSLFSCGYPKKNNQSIVHIHVMFLNGRSKTILLIRSASWKAMQKTKKKKKETNPAHPQKAHPNHALDSW